MAQTTNDKIYNAVDSTRKEINQRIDHLESKIDSNYVTKAEFAAQVAPLKSLVYGLVGLILVAVVGAILSLVVKGQ